MRQFLVAGNWKMNGSEAANAELVAGIAAGMPASDAVELLVCPPFPYLGSVRSQIGDAGIALGAQNVSQHDAGAYTGEVAPSMLKDMGCKYVIVGHSERRELYGETSGTVAEKFHAVQSAGLVPILCVGETLDQREGGGTEGVVAEQLDAVVSLAGIEAFANAVIAYEPVWAIGTGLTATPEQAQSVHAFIRTTLAGLNEEVAANVQILYGGSCKGDNAAGLFAQPDIDGGLIGGASLKAQDFLAIAEAATQV